MSRFRRLLHDEPNRGDEDAETTPSGSSVEMAPVFHSNSFSHPIFNVSVEDEDDDEYERGDKEHLLSPDSLGRSSSQVFTTTDNESRPGNMTDPIPRRNSRGHMRSGSDPTLLGRSNETPRNKKSGTQLYVRSLNKARRLHCRSRSSSEIPGMTTAAAIQKLAHALNILMIEQESIIPKANIRQLFKQHPYRRMFSIIILISIIFLFISAASEGLVRVYIEATFLTFSLFFTLIFEVRELSLQRAEPLQKLKKIVTDLERLNKYRTGDLYHHGAPKTQVADLFATMRDGRWITLPVNLLVEGDLIEVSIGDIFPCHCISLETQEEFKAKEIFQGLPGYEPSKFSPEEWADQSIKTFECKETPCIQNIKQTLNLFTDNHHPPTPLDRLYNFIQKKLGLTLIITMCSTLIVNICRYFVSPASHEWSEMLIQRPIYSVLPVLPLTFPLFLPLLRAFGNARLLTLAEQIQNKPPPNPDDPSSSSTDEFEAEEASLPPPSSNQLTMWQILKRFWTLVRGESYCLSRTLKPLDSLGSVTVVSYHDKRGLLSDADPVLEKVLLFSSNLDCVTQLDTSVDPDVKSVIVFDETNWDHYMKSLNPLGLNCLLNNFCVKPELAIHVEDTRKFASISSHEAHYKCEVECICPLPRAIGFSEDISTLFTTLQQNILTVDLSEFTSVYEEYLQSQKQDFRSYPPSLVPYLTSALVEQNQTKKKHLFSRGSPDLILAFCTHIWNGEKVVEIDPKLKQKLIDTFKTWRDKKDMSVVAFSYKPISNEASSCITDGNEGRPNIIKISKGEYNIAQCSLNDIDPVSFEHSPVRSPRNQKIFEIHRNQILNGIVALKLPPQERTQDYVNAMRNAGIRFVFFSPSNPLKTLAFGERLGLETDWNCYINIGQKQHLEPQVLWHEKTKLPRGVENIRKHIDEVDNLPLLIQLFSGSVPSTTNTMIDIFQENGDVVCYIGSSLRPDNTQIFAKADISIGISPSFPARCHLRPVNPFLNTQGNHHHHHSIRPCHESFSTLLTSLPAYLTFPEYISYEDLTELFRECRHLLTNMKQALMFILACHFFLSITLLLSFCTLSPPILHGYQLMWLMWVVVPALTVSYMSSSTEPDIMNLMPAKNTDEIEDISRFVVYFLLRFVPTTIVVQWIFICSLWNLWPDATFASMFGALNDKGVYDSDEYWSALIYAQSITLFFIVLYMATMSMGFLHRIHSITKIRPYDNLHWVYASLACILSQLIFSGTSISMSYVELSLSALPWHLYVLGFCWPLIIVAVDEMVKKHDKKCFLRFQKRLKLELNTKLGMHSPV